MLTPFRTVLILVLAALSLGGCAGGQIPADSPAGRYEAGGAAAITGAFDFGLF